jgi:cation diffusion facilitator family transporter
MGASLAVSVLMLIGKLTAYFITGSAAIMADASESIVHLAATGFAAYSLWYSLRPADDCHPYGHGRISFFSAGFEGALVFIASMAVIGSGLYELRTGPDVEEIGIGLAITSALAAVNLALGVILLTVGRRSNSIVLIANGKHVLTDVYTTAAAIVGLVLVLITGKKILDPLAAIVIGFLIMAGGFSLIRSAVAGLMDHMPADLRRELDTVIERSRAGSIIRDIHEMRARLVDGEIWLEMHILVDGKISVTEAHEAVTLFEQTLDQTMSGHRLRVSSHIEPIEHHHDHPEGH